MLALAQCGGWATRAELRAFVDERHLDGAVRTGLVQRVGRGSYALAGFDVTRGAAAELHAVISHRSAALAHGWSVRSEPHHPELTVARTRKVSTARRRHAALRWRDLADSDITEDRVTTPLRTVVDCARDLPITEALAVADSALRSGVLDPDDLVGAVSTLPRSRRVQAELVLRQATDLAANPFESALRGLVLQATGPVFTPQVQIAVGAQRVRPDLVSESLRIVLEADSHEFHTKRAQLVRDCWRYNELSLDGWLVLRFAWDQVMFDEDWVQRVVSDAVVQRATCTSGNRRRTSA